MQPSSQHDNTISHADDLAPGVRDESPHSPVSPGGLRGAAANVALPLLILIAAIAIGAQNSVHDYMNGLHILLEDRFGEGDTVQLTTDMGETVEGVVTRLGAFATRIDNEDGAFHIANRRAFQVRNLSQRGHQRQFDVHVERVFDTDGEARAAVTAAIAKAVAESLGATDLGVVVDAANVESVRRGRSTLRVTCRFSRAVTDEQLGLIGSNLGTSLGS